MFKNFDYTFFKTALLSNLERTFQIIAIVNIQAELLIPYGACILEKNVIGRGEAKNQKKYNMYKMKKVSCP